MSIQSHTGFVVLFNGQNYTASVNGQTFRTQLLSQMESILEGLDIILDDNWLVD